MLGTLQRPTHGLGKRGGKIALFVGACLALALVPANIRAAPESRQIRVKIAGPGNSTQEVSMRVHEVPVDPPSVEANQARLKGKDLVLGVVVDGKAMAYPIRYLALHEVVDGQVGGSPLALTW